MEKAVNLFKGWKRKEEIFLALVIGLAFVIFLITVKHYGAGYDEPYLYDYANANITAYSKLALNQPYQNLFSFADLRYYGPAYLILGGELKNLVQVVLPGLDPFDAWHVVNFAAFLFSAWMLFSLCLYFVSKKGALFTALLYISQPLLWGHGIMNPKDTPFMVFFIISITAGFKMVEKVNAPDQPEAPPGQVKSSKLSRYLWGRGTRYLSVFGLLLLLAVGLDRFLQNRFSLPVITAAVNTAWHAPDGTFLHSIFSRLAARADQVSIADYIQKAAGLVNSVEFAILVLACVLVAVYLILKAGPKVRWTILAGVVLGITTSIRILGPAAAGLVLVYILAKRIRIPLRYILIYLGSCLLAAFILWPFLWIDPVTRFAESFVVMANFPWPGLVRFEGLDFRPKALPWYYLPKLLAIQFSLPLVLLAVAGIGLSIYKLAKRGHGWQ
jgi:hypothetical protein